MKRTAAVAGLIVLWLLWTFLFAAVVIRMVVLPS